jgi:hypothetical protein
MTERAPGGIAGASRALQCPGGNEKREVQDAR